MSSAAEAPTEQPDQYLPYDKVITRISDYVYGYTTEKLRPRAWQRAETALVDSLGCAIETLVKSPQCVKLLGPVVPGTTVPNGFKLPGTNHVLDPVKGAFDLGSLIRYLDHNDALSGKEWGHPSDNLGALLALADYLSRSGDAGPNAPPMTIGTLLEAMIKAYEVQGNFQYKNAFNEVGIDQVILVKIASTAVACWLLGLSQHDCNVALSHAWVDGQALRTYRQEPNTVPRKGWAGGDAAARAIQLAYIAKAGQPGLPTAITCEKYGFYDASFRSKEFQFIAELNDMLMMSTFFKIIAAEGHAQTALEATQKLNLQIQAAEKPVNIEKDVKSVTIRTHNAAMVIIDKKGKLQNAADRDHCMQYAVSVVLLKGKQIVSADYEDDSPFASDPRVDALREKITMWEDEELNKNYHDPKKRQAGSGVTITLHDGRVFGEEAVLIPLGSPHNPATDKATHEKARENFALMFSNDRIEKIMKGAGDRDMAVKDFVDLLVPETK